MFSCVGVPDLGVHHAIKRLINMKIYMKISIALGFDWG
jgi:hypothetical protein